MLRVVDANVIVDCPSPVLVRACEEGKVEFVEVLLKYGANVSTLLVRGKLAVCQCFHQNLLTKGHNNVTTTTILNVVIVSIKHLLHVYHCQ